MDRIPMPLLIALVFLLALVVVLGCSDRGRRTRLEGSAAALGLRYVGRSDTLARSTIRSLPSIAAADRSFFTHVMEGADAIVFDWTWRQGMLKLRRREVQTVVALQRSGAERPAFVWTERDAETTSLERALGEPISFPDAPGFGDRYALRGADRPALRARFEAAEPATLRLPEGVRVEGAGEWIAAWRPGRRLEPEEIRALLEALRPTAQRL
ncbi:MAG: hypothetical protein H6748_13660 [Spirochaetaceae bacterium]|nr:hypothetical protein [Myxococcales bacterium]MCB9725091.1 hypothetical protein [Spirochaetaceae bacterium]